MNKELREMVNEVRITGRIKSKNIEEKTTEAIENYTGHEHIKGRVVIETKDEDKVHNHFIDIYSPKFNAQGNINGFFKGYKTVNDEYEDGDLVTVIASIDINEYSTQSGNFISNNNIKARFFNRLTEPVEKEGATADLELVIESLEPETDIDGLPTGDYILKGLNTAYYSRKNEETFIIPLHEIRVSSSLYEQIKPYYLPGETVRITCKLNNYAKVKKQKAKEMTFGEVVDYDVATEYVNEMRMIGGRMPIQDDGKFSIEDVETMKKYRQNQIDRRRGAANKVKVSDFAEVNNEEMAFTDETEVNEIPDF